MSTNAISKKRKFVADGLLFAELNHFLVQELAEDGYAGVLIRKTPTRTEIVIRATRTKEVLGEKGRRIRELQSVIQKRFGFPENSVDLYALQVKNKGLCALAQAHSIKFKLLAGLAPRRACYGVLRFVMDNGAKGVEVIVSGKVKGGRAKALKFKDGYMLKTGEVKRNYIDRAVCHVNLRQGVLGVQVAIMLPHDPTGENGVSIPQPDVVTVLDPQKEEIFENVPEHKN